MTTARLGARSAATVTTIGIAYVVVLAAGMLRHGLSDPIADPILAAMEVLTIASALPLLAMFVALRATVPATRRPLATLALLVATLFCCTTIGVHVGELTADRTTRPTGLVWPSVPYALELLAWDLLLGFALLLASVALPPTPVHRAVRTMLRLTGALCVAGFAGPLTGRMRLQFVGVAGYAILLPVTMWMLARWFGRVEHEAHDAV